MLPSGPRPLRVDRSSLPLRVHVTLFAVQLSFSLLAVEGKLAMGPAHRVSPQALAMARILGAALVFIGGHILFRTPKVSRLRDMGTLALLSLLGVVINQALYLAGLKQTSPVSATLLVAMVPVFTAGVAAVTGRERLSLRKGAGIAVALFGVAALSGFAVPHRGDVLVLLNSFSYALYVVFAQSALERFGMVTVVAWVFGCGALFFAPVGAVALAAEAPTWPLSTTGLVALIVAMPTVFAYAANAWVLRRAGPTLVAIYIYLQPLCVALLSFLQLGQALDLRTALSGIVIFAGVSLVASAPRRGAADPDSLTRASS
jgi:drug/metabolite transporter (DMT)-like permease